jgi:hypothetical protein
MIKLFGKVVPYHIAVFIGELIYSTILSGILLIVAFKFNSNIFLTLNYDALMQSLIALNSGILVAIFVALFYSNEENMTILKKFKNASRQTVTILLVNSFSVGVATLFTMNIPDLTEGSDTDRLLWSNLMAISISLVVTVVNASEVYQLVKLSLRKDNSDKLPKN